MKLFKDRLHAPVLPHRLLHKLGLIPSKYQSWKLTPEQRDMLLEEIGQVAPRKTRAPRPAKKKDEKPMYPHQQDGVDFLRALDWRGAVFYDMGTGKTRIAIEALKESGTLSHAIILAPLSVVQMTWPAELREWAGVQGTVVTGSLEHRLALIERPGPWVLNYDGLKIRRCMNCDASVCECRKRPRWVYPIVEALLERGPKAIVLDESARIKDWTTRTSKVVLKLSKMIDGPRIPMTGTPNPNQPYDLWAQFKVIANRPLGFSTPYAMRNEYCLMGGYMGREIVGHRRLGELNQRLSKIAIRRRLDDCITLPERVFIKLPVTLTPKEMKAYKQMAKDSLAELGRSKTLTADNVMVKVLRLQQLTGGAAAPRLSGAKMAVLQDVVQDSNLPGIIWCRFVDEIKTVARVLGKQYRCRTFYGATSPRERADALEAFANGGCDLLIGQPQAGGIGLNLQAADWMCFYSQSFSAMEREQALGRNYRSGQKRKTRVLYLLAEGTVDMHVAKALDKKISVSRAALDGYKEWMS